MRPFEFDRSLFSPANRDSLKPSDAWCAGVCSLGATLEPACQQTVRNMAGSGPSGVWSVSNMTGDEGMTDGVVGALLEQSVRCLCPNILEFAPERRQCPINYPRGVRLEVLDGRWPTRGLANQART